MKKALLFALALALSVGSASAESVVPQTVVEDDSMSYTDITHGDKGDHVSKLQEQLKALGYYDGNISGKYDTETEKAVKRFKKANGLEADTSATAEFQQYLYSMGNPDQQDYLIPDYDSCVSDPEANRGTPVMLEGLVLQVLGTPEAGCSIRLATAGIEDIFYVTIAPGLLTSGLHEDDQLIVCGQLDGVFSYTSTTNVEITLPCVSAESVVLR